MQLIAALNQAPAVADVSGWAVYIQTHFLGGRAIFNPTGSHGWRPDISELTPGYFLLPLRGNH